MAALGGTWTLDFPRHDCDAMFAVAVDIESYPRFLPFCRAARIRRRTGNILEVDNVFGAGPVMARFQTRAELDPPRRLEITTREAPFHLFRLVWTFTPLPAGGCRVTAEYRIDLRSHVLQSLAHLSLTEMERRILQGFRDRVRKLYPGTG